MSDDTAMAAAVEHVGAYLAIKAQIAALEAWAEEARANVAECLRTSEALPGKVWAFAGLGAVSIVKGRAGKAYIDRARLARAGVDPKVIDEATVTPPAGKPSMRISVEVEGASAEAA